MNATLGFALGSLVCGAAVIAGLAYRTASHSTAVDNFALHCVGVYAVECDGPACVGYTADQGIWGMVCEDDGCLLPRQLSPILVPGAPAVTDPIVEVCQDGSSLAVD